MGGVGERPTLILILMMKKVDCLKHAVKLGNDLTFHLSPDLTLQDRKERRKLLTELKNRKEKGVKDIIIRHGHIVKRTQEIWTNY